MKSKILCFALAVFSLGLISGCGDDDSATGGNSGEYVSSSWHDDTVANLQVKPTGEVSGYLFVMNGWMYRMTGSVSNSGVLTLTITSPEDQQPMSVIITTGKCDGAGTCTGTLYAGPDQPFQYVLVRVNRQTNKVSGIYQAPLARADASHAGTAWFGIDAHGKGYGYAQLLQRTTSITGEALTASGNFTLANVPSASSAVILSGVIGADGTISNGTWTTSTSSGTLSGSRLPLD